MRPSSGHELEEEIVQALRERGEDVQRPGPRPFDLALQGPAGTVVVDVKSNVRGVRDLHAALTQLAISAGHDRSVERAWLIVADSNLTRRRTEEEWEALRAVLHRTVAGKLALTIQTADGPWTSDPALFEPLRAWWENREAKRASETNARARNEALVPMRVHAALPTRKFFEIWKVLLAAWLHGDGALPIHEIGERSGAAHPTVSEALRRMESRGEIRRGSDRRAQLRGWPRTTYAELAPLLPMLRKTHWFVDRTGRGSDATDLLKRFGARPHENVALAGVEAARRMVPSLDLVGLPRLDLTMHVGSGEADLSFVKKLHAGLGPAESESGAVLAVHELSRPVTMFHNQHGNLWLADFAEVALDLGELRLSEQLEEFVRQVSGESRT